MRLTLLISSLFLSALVGLGCGSGSSTSDAAGTGGTGGATGEGGSDGGAFVAIVPCSTATSYMTGTNAVATTADFKYSPACLKVATGAVVTIQASTTHPLSGLGTGSPNNPIPTGGQTTPQTVTFAAPGFYPFHCDVHFSIGMAGVVWVQ